MPLSFYYWQITLYLSSKQQIRMKNLPTYPQLRLLITLRNASIKWKNLDLTTKLGDSSKREVDTIAQTSYTDTQIMRTEVSTWTFLHSVPTYCRIPEASLPSPLFSVTSEPTPMPFGKLYATHAQPS